MFTESRESRKYPTTVTHTIFYYKRVLLALIDGLNRNLTHADIATELNEQGLLTPTGLKFKGQIIKEILKKLRLNKEYSSRFHNKLLQLIVAGEISIASAMILFKQTGVM